MKFFKLNKSQNAKPKAKQKSLNKKNNKKNVSQNKNMLFTIPFFNKKLKPTSEKPVQNNTKIVVKQETHLDLAQEHLKFGFTRMKTRKIVKQILNKKVTSALFYTDCTNLLHQITNGINPVNLIKLQNNQEYKVWTYLEKKDHIELELDNLNRYPFWNWIATNEISPKQIAIYSINLIKLFNNTEKEWSYDEETGRISIFETISTDSIEWLLIKDEAVLEQVKLISALNKLKIKILQSNHGNVKLII